MNNELGSKNQENANTNVRLLQTSLMQFSVHLHLINAKHLSVQKMLLGLLFCSLDL